MPPHSMIEIACRSTSNPSVAKTNGRTSFSVLHEDGCAREEQLAADSVELGQHAKVFVRGHWFWLEGTCSRPRKSFDKDELIKSRDV